MPGDGEHLRRGSARRASRLTLQGRGLALTVLVLSACTEADTRGDASSSDGEAVAVSEDFRIDPLRPIGELREEALAASPPHEEGAFLAPELVDLATLDPTIRFDIRYATANNFMGTPFYESARAFLQRPAGEALVDVNRSLAAHGYGLLIHDAYRPWHVTRMFWDATPEDLKDFVADPERGSRHNRGAAVDLTLYDLASGRVVRMPSGYDEFSERAAPDYEGGTIGQREARDLLRRQMEAAGFEVYEFEWWHFDYREWRNYPIMNATFEELDAGAGPG